jgi:phosphatidylethanolamine/phosphatidyl-N-methylethanolamine N-methyltransferase
MARVNAFRKAFADKFDDELRFFKGWIHRPKAVGSIVPTSSVTARRMATVIDLNSGLPVLEVGPGTGVITRAILRHGVAPENLYAVEYSPEFVRHLRQHFRGVTVIEGDAFDLDNALGDRRKQMFDCVISGVPLLNFAVARRISYLNSLLDRIPHGRPVVQLTYGPKSPIPPGLGDYTVEHFHFIIRNIPPTQLWIYRRAVKN